MMACFGSVAHAPLAVMIMVAEMTGSFSVIPGAMIAVGIAYLLIIRTNVSIYKAQRLNRETAAAERVAVPAPEIMAAPEDDARRDVAARQVTVSAQFSKAPCVQHFRRVPFIAHCQFQRRKGTAMTAPTMMHRLAAEFIGTFWLVLGGCGSAVFAAKFPVRRHRRWASDSSVSHWLSA